MRISRTKFLYAIALFMLMLYSNTIGLTVVIYKNFTLLHFTFIAACVIAIYYGKITKHISGQMVLVFLMCIVICMNNNQDIARGSTTMAYATVSILVFYLYSKKTDLWHSTYLKIASYFGTFYCVATFVLMMLPNVFINKVAPLFITYGGDSYVQANINNYLKGYMPGFTPHYSTNAIYLTIALGIPFAFGVASEKRNQKKYLMMFLITLVALLVTGKRAHAIFAIVAITICYYFFTVDRPKTRWRRILFYSIAGICVLSIIAQFLPSVFNVVYRFIEAADSGDVTFGRDSQRLLALEFFRENPILGIGWNGFQYRFNNIFGYVLNVHCVYVQLLCENGIVGSIPFFLFFITSIYKSAKNVIWVSRNRLIANKNEICFVIFSLYIQAFFLLYCFTGNPLYDAQMLFPYIITCSISDFYYSKIRQQKKESLYS